MKKKLLAAAFVGALASPAAFAQTTVYGLIDLGYQNLKHSDADVNKDFIHHGMHSGSRLGVRGSEDLAGGTYAMYQIEFDITPDTGATAPNGMTNRLTMIGLGSKAWGEFTFGRQYTHTFHTFGVGSSTGGGSFGAVFTWTGFNAITRASNSVKYSSPKLGGFTVGGLWAPSVGGASNNTEPVAAGDDVNYWDGAIRWAGGSFGAAVSYGVNTVEATGGETETTRTQLSANWDNKAFGIYGSWWNMETELSGLGAGGAANDTTGWAISGVMYFGGRNELHLVYGQQENDLVGASESTVWGISLHHLLSKRTRVYTGYQTVNNEAAVARAPNYAATTVANGYDPRAIQLGLVHSF